MARPVRLGSEITLIVSVRRENMGDPFCDLNACRRKLRYLVGIIGEQANLGHAKLAQHLRGRRVDPLVGVEAELLVGVYRINTEVLE